MKRQTGQIVFNLGSDQDFSRPAGPLEPRCLRLDFDYINDVGIRLKQRFQRRRVYDTDAEFGQVRSRISPQIAAPPAVR